MNDNLNERRKALAEKLDVSLELVSTFDEDAIIGHEELVKRQEREWEYLISSFNKVQSERRNRLNLLKRNLLITGLIVVGLLILLEFLR